MQEGSGSAEMLSCGPALLPGCFGYRFSITCPPGWIHDATSSIPSPWVFPQLPPLFASPLAVLVYHPAILVSAVKGFTLKALNRSDLPQVLAEPASRCPGDKH